VYNWILLGYSFYLRRQIISTRITTEQNNAKEKKSPADHEYPQSLASKALLLIGVVSQSGGP
jgi:hypothetical protein